MLFQLALFSALFSIAISQQSPHHREVGVHEASLSTHASAQAHTGSKVRQLADFSWGIAPREGFPVVAFNASTEKSEVEFMYDYTGTLTDSKNISMSLLQNPVLPGLLPSDSLPWRRFTGAAALVASSGREGFSATSHPQWRWWRWW